jgi:ribulose-phosphate 3-epimerase
MAIVCPTVTSSADPHDYREQVERVAPVAQRLHLDFMDGVLAPTVSIQLDQAWLPKDKQVDLHLMYQRPADHIDMILKLKPSLVIVHAEAEGVTPEFAAALQTAKIKLGLALLAPTQPDVIKPLVGYLDHVLIFSGDLGHYGGRADLELLRKVDQIKTLKPDIEIGWDGGINDQNARLLQDGGVDVLNVGGFIQKAINPATAFLALKALLES